MIFGFDFSGVVVSLPPDARNDGLHLGDRVAGVVHGGLYTDEGSFAEYLKVETDLLFVLPSGMAMDEAATFGVAYVTAVQVSGSKGQPVLIKLNFQGDCATAEQHLAALQSRPRRMGSLTCLFSDRMGS